jgi:hypothetical protein
VVTAPRLEKRSQRRTVGSSFELVSRHGLDGFRAR